MGARISTILTPSNKRIMENLPQTEYTDIESVSRYLGIEVPAGSSDEAEDMAKYIRVASRQMDRITGRILYTDEETTVTYDPSRSGVLVIGDMAEITELKIDGVVIAPTEYVTYPQRKPYISRIALIDRLWSTSPLSVAIKGYHAMFKELPEDIQHCATVLAAGIYQTAYPPEDAGAISSESIGNYKATYTTPKQAVDASSSLALLNTYKRIAL